MRRAQLTSCGPKAPEATLKLWDGVNHVLKVPQGADRAANLRAYADPSLPIAPSAVHAIAGFVKR